MRTVTCRSAAALIALAACSETPTSELASPQFAAGGVQEKVTGGGQFVHPVFGTVAFSFNAIRHADGSVSGHFQQNQFDVGASYKGKVTCFAVDLVNNRAWIAGDLTKSNDPSPVTEIGDDAWFRVLDLGQGAGEPDRSTFLGFEGSAGIITSEEYCAVRLWAPNNERTWPVSGNIQID
jgi:hypothetical protein